MQHACSSTHDVAMQHACSSTHHVGVLLCVGSSTSAAPLCPAFILQCRVQYRAYETRGGGGGGLTREGGGCRAAADANARDKAGQTPLHVAALRGETEAVRILWRLGGAVDARDNSGFTPVERALEAGCNDTALLLIRTCGASLDDGVAEAHAGEAADEAGAVLAVQARLDAAAARLTREIQAAAGLDSPVDFEVPSVDGHGPPLRCAAGPAASHTHAQALHSSQSGGDLERERRGTDAARQGSPGAKGQGKGARPARTRGASRGRSASCPTGGGSDEAGVQQGARRSASGKGRAAPSTGASRGGWRRGRDLDLVRK